MAHIQPSRPYNFNELSELRWRYKDRKFIGPMPLLDDPILVAGLLFVPFNSWSTRTIESGTHRGNGVPHVCLAFHHDFADSDLQWIPITHEAREQLLQGGYVEGTPTLGFTDMHELKLSQRGNQTVVTNWFKTDADVMQYLAAGASLHADGRITW